MEKRSPKQESRLEIPGLDEIRQSYVQGLPRRISQVEEAVGSLKRHPGDAGPLRQLQIAAHGIAGSAATFGFTELGLAARGLESRAADLLERGAPIRATDLTSLTENFETLLLAAPRPTPSNPSSSTAHRDRPSGAARLVHVVDDDEAFAREVAEQLSMFGFRVTPLLTPGAFQEELRRATPAAVIMDLAFPEGVLHGIDIARSARAEGAKDVPVVFLTGRADFTTRLEAVRAGAAGYLVKPVDFGALAEVLDHLAPVDRPRLSRVLVIDDDSQAGQVAAVALRAAGIECRIVETAASAPGAIDEFRPDLILLDYHLDGCTGAEVARVIRQEVSNVAIPIVFLSSEEDPDLQAEAIRSGGDGFIRKPFHVGSFVAEVQSRLRRSAVLQSKLLHDSLTGCLNHGAFMDRLGREHLLRGRSGESTSVVLIDIDDFKRTNDTSGHAVGDLLLRELSRIMRRRFRRSDVVGRLGGDEFGVILPAAGAREAEALVEGVRLAFSGCAAGTTATPAACRFSAGIAESRPGEAPTRLLLRADEALYRAKQLGKGRTATAWATE